MKKEKNWASFANNYEKKGIYVVGKADFYKSEIAVGRKNVK
jgi:hypothetical protein